MPPCINSVYWAIAEELKETHTYISEVCQKQ